MGDILYYEFYNGKILTCSKILTIHILLTFKFSAYLRNLDIEFRFDRFLLFIFNLHFQCKPKIVNGLTIHYSRFEVHLFIIRQNMNFGF